MTYAKLTDTKFTKTETVETVIDIEEIKKEIAATEELITSLEGNLNVSNAKVAALEALLVEADKIGVKGVEVDSNILSEK